ncbi:hypothetical protein QIS74_00098 [Colletotrichum tabaci]|uniref:Uncharacterized protein n=1 Tax=Colletotrichum tabaci TaxID=1209068 RepID=A0AAV9TT68_9PEZI
MSRTSKSADRAKWTPPPLGEIIEYEVGVRAGIRFVLKIGVHAQIFVLASPRRPASATEDVVSDMMGQGSSSELTYDSEPLGNKTDFDSVGCEFAICVDPDGATWSSPTACTGNILWATADDVLLFSGAQRPIHYYDDTMSLVPSPWSASTPNSTRLRGPSGSSGRRTTTPGT